MKTIEGKLSGVTGRVAIVAGRFNGFVVESLIAGARDTLVRHGIDDDDLTLVRVPGAFEIPAICARLASSGDYDAVIATGAV
ncbi:MAG: 6,7-dimethyl-8-ribityllumazine synthase, partial [Pseudomonadota bacterium]